MPARGAEVCEKPVDFPSPYVSVGGGYKGTTDIHAGDSGTGRYGSTVRSGSRACAIVSAGMSGAPDRFLQSGTDWIWGRMADTCAGDVDRYSGASASVFWRRDALLPVCALFSEKRTSAGSVLTAAYLLGGWI